ncbi:uncharacterized protein ColSpa_10316 [Colletotrichum spaethianum]|uniref:Uncharacterized protein n=1 Tax=Colletotrichum spaethianum TaxID=700344 RepID=A0AA37PD88_9PEZI|nr:uncharacterized protein ColSpa_10316 [Colletotrichum spaethianum]GKT50135.1 hypothetical protein ColSpa_10316 [Colletotrichum spaethianum]
MSHAKASSGQSALACFSPTSQNAPYSVDRYINESSPWTSLSQRSDSPRTSYSDPMHSDLDGLLRQAQQRPKTSKR